MGQAEDNELEAYKAMESYAEDAARVFAIINGDATDEQVAAFASDLGTGVDDVDQAAATDYLHESMALSLEVDNTAHEVRLVFCTGGPHYELRWEQGERGRARAPWFLALPWFGRVEVWPIPAALVTLAEYYAELVDGMGGVEHLLGYDEEAWFTSADEDDEDGNV